MVGYMPWDVGLRKERTIGFIHRIKQSQIFGPDNVPLILQYDERFADLRPWLWPAERGVLVRPEDLDSYRYTHYFKAPICPCTYLRRGGFTETKIGLVQMVLQPGTSHCLGQYVAICSTQECGYYVVLEKYYNHPKLLTGTYVKRDEPIKVMDPFLFMTDDTEETIKRTGLQQMHVLQDESNTGIRGTNKLLRREDPEHFLKLQDSLESLIAKGIPADKFWDLFVQCTSCRYVMPRQYFPYYHACIVEVVHPQLGLPRRLPAPNLPALPESDSDIDYTNLPGPASSDANLGPNAVAEYCALLEHTHANPAEPVTPKPKRRREIASRSTRSPQ